MGGRSHRPHHADPDSRHHVAWITESLIAARFWPLLIPPSKCLLSISLFALRLRHRGRGWWEWKRSGTEQAKTRGVGAAAMHFERLRGNREPGVQISDQKSVWALRLMHLHCVRRSE